MAPSGADPIARKNSPYLPAEQFQQIGDLLPGNPGDRERTADDHHRFVNGISWALRSGVHWHDLPNRYRNWNSSRQRFSRRARTGVWEAVFKPLLEDPKNDYVMIDSSLIKARQKAATNKKGAGDPVED